MNTTLDRFRSFWSHGMYREAFREIVIWMFAVDSIGSVFTRAAIWFAIAIVIIASVDTFQKGQDYSPKFKSNVGFFLGFLLFGGVLMYLLFGFAPFVTSASASTH